MKVDIQTLEDVLVSGRTISITLSFSTCASGDPIVDYKVIESNEPHERDVDICEGMCVATVADALKEIQENL